MNIFYLSNFVSECAKYHVDRHVTKMCIEYPQLLSTAHRLLDGTEYYDKTSNGRQIKRWMLPDKRETLLMKSTHPKHPSAMWCRESKENYLWLYNLWKELLSEYTYRYGKIHACSRLLDVLATPPSNISNKPFTEPTPAMPEDVKVSGDSVQSYRNYYINNKTHLASWSGKVNSRNIPEWFHAII
jgi:hypothetical protein